MLQLRVCLYCFCFFVVVTMLAEWQVYLLPSFLLYVGLWDSDRCALKMASPRYTHVVRFYPKIKIKNFFYMLRSLLLGVVSNLKPEKYQ